ncbi:MAG: hypothetical protein CVU65_02095 [Deltaproteobacteria bacterium HGW-Deltaproteobacteria-22]|nr:MAG: hypothetical protein CVU65_02095 [Deltaproteobacteria bacterium HGW-Deltaproteobacteria-22]
MDVFARGLDDLEHLMDSQWTNARSFFTDARFQESIVNTFFRTSLMSLLAILILSCDDSGKGGEPDAEISEPDFSRATFHVAPDGDDEGPGTLDAPFATPERARDAVRALREAGGLPETGAIITLRGGTYRRDRTFLLEAEDSGDEDQPVWYGAYPGETVRFTGGAVLPAGDFAPVTETSDAWSRLRPEARGKVVMADLTALGITDLGVLSQRGFSVWEGHAALEVSWDGEPLELARWPNRDQTDPEDLTADAILSGDRFGTGTTFVYQGTTAAGNVTAGLPNYRAELAGGEIWYLYHCTWEWGGATHRYWFLSGADPAVEPNCWPSEITSWAASGTWPVPVLDPLGGEAAATLLARTRPEDFSEHGFLRIYETDGVTTLRIPGDRHLGWATAQDPWLQGLFKELWADDTLPAEVFADGLATLDDSPSYGIEPLRPFFVLNLLEELDVPGEYWVDRNAGLLYLWPPSEPGEARIEASIFDGPLLEVRDAEHLRFAGLDFSLTRGSLVRLTNVRDVVVRRTRLTHAGGTAMTVSGTDSGLERCTVSDSGGGGVRLDGGDRVTLSPGGLFVRNCDIGRFGRWDRTYKPAVSISGCGNTVAHNRLHDAPHAAVLFSGNDHRIEYNIIERVVGQANDAGAVYTGRDWGFRGNRIAYNFFHDIRSIFNGANGVYLDDAASGIEVFGNVFFGVTGYATLSGGGRDNRFENNIIVDAQGAHYSDRRAQAVANDQWSAEGCPDDWNLLGRIQVVYETCWDGPDPIAYRSAPWSDAYASLAVIPAQWSQVAGSHWLDPEGCVFARNVLWRNEAGLFDGNWGGTGALASYAQTTPNLEGVDPLFTDEAGLDLTLRAGSPAFDLEGFEAIPFGMIGIEP